MISYSYWAALKALRVFQVQEYAYTNPVVLAGAATFVVLTIGGWYVSLLDTP